MVVRAAIGNAGNQRLDEATVMIIDARNPDPKRISQWSGNGAFQNRLIIAAIRPCDIAAPILCRLVGDELDSAAGRVATKERSLRPAKRLDACKVKDRKARSVDRTRIGIVLINRDWRFLLVAIIILRDATDIEHHLR